MKKLTYLCAFLLTVSSLNTSAQFFQNVKYHGAFGDLDWTRPWSNYKATMTDYNPTIFTLSGKIEKNTTLLKKNVYLLSGPVYISNNATLTIEAGTIIRGDFESCGTLIVTRGSKIIANGTETDPIVFTSNQGIGSRKAGDWGGLVILGNAPINTLGGLAVFHQDADPKLAQYGGNNDEDNSGILRYVRVEFPGHKFNKTKELNGLSLCGVGNKTLIENVQISHSNDDSFELYGGTVNLKNVISYKCSDDDFDFTMGYTGMIQFGMALRHPLVSDYSGSRCIELESYSDVKNYDANKRVTDVTFANLTLVSLSVMDNAAQDLSMTREAVFVDNHVNLSITNSLICGFKSAVLFKSATGLKEKFIKGSVKFNNNTVNKYLKAFDATEIKPTESLDWISKRDDFSNRYSNIEQNSLFKEVVATKHFDLRVIDRTMSDNNKPGY